MSRKKKAPKKIIVVDPKYKSSVIPKLINSIMYDGKKTIAEKIVYDAIDKIKTKSNYSGGIQGGISNGEDIYFNVAFKPVSTIMKDQQSVDSDNNKVTVSGKGRHDPCVVPRAVPIVEAMAANVLVDLYLQSKK